MFITIFGSIGILCFIVIVYKLFFSTSDEIPASSKLPELPKTNKVYQAPEPENSTTIKSAPDNQYREEKRTRSAIFHENQEKKSQGKAQKISDKIKEKHSYTTTFQKLCERPNLISFSGFLEQTNVGFNRNGKTHYFICMLFYPFLILFRLFLYLVSWLGTFLFEIVIRILFEVFIRSIGKLLKILFESIFH